MVFRLKEDYKNRIKTELVKELEIKNVQMQVEKLKAEFPGYIDRIWWAYYDLEEKKVYPVVDWEIK